MTSEQAIEIADTLHYIAKILTVITVFQILGLCMHISKGRST